MKKVVTMLLVIVLLLPAAALAITDQEVVGCYVYYELLTTGCPSMTMFYLGPDHVCYYLIQQYRHDEPSLGRAYVGTWEMQSDGSVYAKTGNKTSMNLIIPEGASIAYNKDLNQYFINISLYDSMIK